MGRHREKWQMTLEYTDAGISEFMTDPVPSTGRGYGPPRSGPGLVRTLDDSLRLEHGRHYRHAGTGVYEIYCPDGRWRIFTRFTNHANIFLPEDHPAADIRTGRTLADDVNWMWDKFVGHANLGSAVGDPRKTTRAGGIGIYVLGTPNAADYKKLFTSNQAPRPVDPSWADRLEELRLLPCYDAAATGEVVRDRIRQAVVQSTPTDCWRTMDGGRQPTLDADGEEYVWVTNMDDPFDLHNHRKWRECDYKTDDAFRLHLAACIQFQLLHFVGPPQGGWDHMVGVYAKPGEQCLVTSGYSHTSRRVRRPFYVDLSLADDLPRSKWLVRCLNTSLYSAVGAAVFDD